MIDSRRPAWLRTKFSSADREASPPDSGVTHAHGKFTTRNISAGRPVRVLLVCHLFILAYRALRCAQAAGATVIVLGNDGSKGFRFSLFCERFVPSSVSFDGSIHGGIASEINRVAAEFDIDIVMPGDAPSTRSMIGVREKLQVQTFPLPDLGTFDLLNDKWQFAELCRHLGIGHPRSCLVERRVDLSPRISANTLTFPLVAKPLSLNGGEGVTVIHSRDVPHVEHRVFYEPILLQDYIDGIDIGASVYCRSGTICAWIMHKILRATYITFHDEAILSDIRKIVEQLRLDGIFNFDMRMSKAGNVYFLECNPRVFYKMNLSMLAGINFVGLGLIGSRECGSISIPPGTNVRMPKALMASLMTPWRLTRRDVAMLSHLYSDPIRYLRELLSIDWEPY
ncbi:MAG TPA: ATP-grasp domain-containing protein [Rhizomicrobium sp.]|jgi:hypothetical protein|nr:ATP-grasp domain-containing protein [Rhizomicrobium sp.]